MDGQDNGRFRGLVDALLQSYREDADIIKIEARNQIDKAATTDILAKLRCLVFAGYFTSKPLKEQSLDYYVGEIMEDIAHNLKKQIGRALRHLETGSGAEEPSARAERLALSFLERLPAVRRMLAADVEASLAGDPAAFSREEIILSYPGVYAVMVYRLAHELYLLGIPLIPRMMTEHAHGLTGIDIHPGASIGHHLFIDHGTGIVIGETTVIGNHVKIYQGVTLGALSTRGGQLLRGVKRHPTVEDHVTIYSGASILGGETVIGEGVVIGSNAFITKSVPEKTRVSVRNPELLFKENSQARSVEFRQEEFWDYVI